MAGVQGVPGNDDSMNFLRLNDLVCMTERRPGLLLVFPTAVFRPQDEILGALSDLL